MAVTAFGQVTTVIFLNSMQLTLTFTFMRYTVMTDRPNYSNSIRWTQPYGSVGGWRKRQIIDSFVDSLHSQQLDYIDEAVVRSDLAQAKEVIEYIKNKA